jgi:membrane protein, MarC family
MDAILEMFRGIGLGLVVILPLANPLTTVALLLGMSGKMSQAERDRQSFWASVYVFLIMTVAFYGGQLIMNTFGISIPGLRIAGGLIVCFIGFRMLFPQQHLEDEPAIETRAEEIKKERVPNIAFIPLAMPSTAGPGTIALLISSAATLKAEEITPWVFYIAPVLTFFLVALILYICLLSSGAIMRVFGKSGIEAISRLMGFLLVCIGVQFLINGVLEIVAGIQNGTMV